MNSYDHLLNHFLDILDFVMLLLVIPVMSSAALLSLLSLSTCYCDCETMTFGRDVVNLT